MRLHKKPRKSGSPYRRVAAELRAEIMSGVLKRGTMLPSTSQLAARFNVSTSSVQAATRALGREGLLRGEMGVGVHVLGWQPITEATSHKVLEVAEVRPPIDVAAALGLATDDTAVLRRRVMLHAGEPVGLAWSYYPLEIAAGTPLGGRAKITVDAAALLAALGYPQRDVVETTGFRLPTTEELEALNLPDDVPVFDQLRVVYSDERRPVEASVLVKAGHRFHLTSQGTIPDIGATQLLDD